MAHLHPLFYYRGMKPQFYYRGLGHTVLTPAFSLAAAAVILTLAVTLLIALQRMRTRVPD